MIGLALLLAVQGATPSAETLATRPPVVATPPARAAQAIAPGGARVPIDPVEAIALFRSLCLPNLTDDGAFAVAVAASEVPFTAIPRRDAGAGQTWRSDRALLSYGQARDGSRRCALLGRTARNVDQLGLSAKLAEALALKTGRTRMGKGQAVTEWSAAGPDGKLVQISAATRNAATGGGTDIRLSAAMAQ
jgi:hypothetical protein